MKVAAQARSANELNIYLSGCVGNDLLDILGRHRQESCGRHLDRSQGFHGLFKQRLRHQACCCIIFAELSAGHLGFALR